MGKRVLFRPHAEISEFRLLLRLPRFLALLGAAALFLTLTSPYVHAQLYDGSLTGVVVDPSGAAVPNAKVILTDENKGFAFNATTDVTGRYLLRYLPPSIYRLAVEAPGFKTYSQSGIVLEVKQAATVDVSLVVGTVVQRLEVTSTAPLLATQDAVNGQEVNRTYINDLPLIDRNVLDLTYLAPGINAYAGNAYGVINTNINNFTSNGSRNMNSDVLIDGVGTTVHAENSQEREVVFTPSIDAVQEFKVEQNNFSADTGFSGGTVLNVVMRSGTNQFHGTAYDFLRNQVLDSNNWFNNAGGAKLPPLRRNDFGAVLGGPIRKDKTFFFADYEGTRVRSLSAYAGGVPDASEKQGDFGELCGYAGGTFNSSGMCSNPSGQLWDPYTGVYNAALAGPVRGAYIPFNNLATYQSPGAPALAGTPYQIPATVGNVINPVAYNIMQYFPSPNYNVGTPAYNPYINFRGSGVNMSRSDGIDVRIDHHLSDRTLLTGRFSYGNGAGQSPNCFHNALDPCSSGVGTNFSSNAVLNVNHSFSQSTVLTLSYGYVQAGWASPGGLSNYPSFDPQTTLGLPEYLKDSGVRVLPAIQIYGGYATTGGAAIGNGAWSIAFVRHEVHDLLGSLDHIQGRHEIKFGGEFRMERQDYLGPGTPGGYFGYDFPGTAQQTTTGPVGGDAMATFLTGTSYSSWGEYEIPARPATQMFSYAAYAQDNWRASRKLTVNLGLRYEVETPRTERHNQMEYFDPNIPLPLTVPGLPNLHGGDVFVGPGNRSIANTYYKEIQPRVGLAYRLTPKLVARAGYGIFYNTFNFAPTGNTYQGFDGYDEVTSLFETYQNDGATPWAWISNPWPIGGPLLPTRNSLGALTELGITPTGAIRTWNTVPNTQTWSMGFQRELPGNLLIDANYVGTKGTHLLYGGYNNLNYLGPWVQSATPAQITALNSYVPNPFYGIITNPTSSMSGPTIPDVNLEVPYPQFTSTDLMEPPWANSIYNAAQFRLEKRFSNGLQFLLNYTISKSIDDSSVQGENDTGQGGFLHLRDPNNLKLERGLSQYDIPQVLGIAYVYELPVGRGKPVGKSWNKWVDGFLGGWQTNGIWRFDNGQPLGISETGGVSLPTYGQNPDLNGKLQINPRSQWFCSSPGCGYFSNPGVATLAAPFTLGTSPSVLPSVRAPGTRNATLSLFKEFSLASVREGMRLEYRLESFNALNHPQFAAPGTTVNSANFGVVSSQANFPREVQMALKLYF
jgi:hypothetical protein